MVNYETLMLIRTEITNDEMSNLEKSLDKIISTQKGHVTLFDKWGRYRLSYPVNKQAYGIYVLVRFEAETKVLNTLFSELDTLFKIKFNELVMRHVTTKLNGSSSSVYNKPDPISSHGSSGSSNLDSFIKKNKMEGLIDTKVKSESKKTDEQPVKTTLDKKDEEKKEKTTKEIVAES